MAALTREDLLRLQLAEARARIAALEHQIVSLQMQHKYAIPEGATIDPTTGEVVHAAL
jgi:hypothetical protein